MFDKMTKEEIEEHIEAAIKAEDSGICPLCLMCPMIGDMKFCVVCEEQWELYDNGLLGAEDIY